MLHRVMIKTTPLHDVAGRVDYISNPDRQEQLVYADEACADLGFWKDLSAYCQKSAPGKRAREGRELIIPLPNEFSKEIPPEDIANAICSSQSSCGTTESKQRSGFCVAVSRKK